jgi:hypothetical protein
VQNLIQLPINRGLFMIGKISVDLHKPKGKKMDIENSIGVM